MTGDAQPKVSVVVPVYAPGPYVRPLLDSLDRQAPLDGGFEVIFADDGSPDATPQLLETWARRRPWAHVLRLAPSGWPSHPRNVGMENARGEYVYFVDHDDWLADDALTLTTSYARECAADIVVGRMQGLGRRVPVRLFDHSVRDARAPETMLPASMTVHVLLRTDFLRAEGIRFDESLRRLEDHLFMANAYMRASRVAVWADSPVYRHAAREDSANAGHRSYDPAEYYEALVRAIDVVLTARPPGAERDAYLARWVRGEMVDRLRSDAVRWLEPRTRDRFHAEVQNVLRTRIPAAVIRGLSREYRWSAALAQCATAEEFWSAHLLLASSTRDELADRPGTDVFTRSVSAQTLRAATALLGGDPPVPLGPAARSARGRRLGRLRRRLLAGLSRVSRGSVQQRIIAWGRSRSKMRRDCGVVVAAGSAIAAGVLTLVGADIIPVLGLAALAAALTAWLAFRALHGWGTAVRQTLALLPAVVVAVRDPDPSTLGPIAAAAALIAAALLTDRHWRRSDVRGYPGRHGPAWRRVGWIGLAASVVSTAVVGVDVLVLWSP